MSPLEINNNDLDIFDTNINPDNFTINFNLNKIKLLIVQDNNILFDDCIIKKIINDKIIYIKKKLNNIELCLDKPIYLKISNTNNEIIFDILFDSNSFNLIDRDNKKYCFVEYLFNKALTFNLNHYVGNKVFFKSVYLTFRN